MRFLKDRLNIALFIIIILIILAVLILIAEAVFFFRLPKNPLPEISPPKTQELSPLKKALEEKFRWQPTKLMSYPRKSGQKIFVILAKLEKKYSNLWQAKPANNEKLEVKITPQTKFYLRKPFTDEHGHLGEKSEETSQESFSETDTIMIEWLQPGINDEKEMLDEKGHLKKEYWQISALTISLRK